MLDNLLKKPWFPMAIRIVLLVAFMALMLSLYLGDVLGLRASTAMIMIWTLWWPLLYISLLFVARGWCGFLCPLGLANEAGNYLHKGRAINFVKYGFIAYVVFFLVVYWEQISGLFLSVSTTLLFLGVFSLAAFVTGILIQRMLFCRLFCPIGTILGIFSRLSFIGIRTDRGVCKECKTKECLIGGKTQPCVMFNNVPSINTNRNCLICSNCVKNCPHNSARLRWVKPGEELWQDSEQSYSESAFIIALLGFATVLTTKGTELARFMNTSLSGSLLRGMDFVVAIGAAIILFLAASLLSSAIGRLNLKTSLLRFGYAYLPLVFFIMLFTITFDFLGPWLNLGDSAIIPVKSLLLVIGMAWSVYAAYKISAVLSNRPSAIPHIALILLVGMLWFLALIPNSGKEVTVVAGEDFVDIEAYSMGYKPNIILAKEGPVKLRIHSKDITHAFDINEFNVHLVLKGGETKEVLVMADKKGKFRIHCSIPGHTEAGMKGYLIVD